MRCPLEKGIGLLSVRTVLSESGKYAGGSEHYFQRTGTGSIWEISNLVLFKTGAKSGTSYPA